MADSSKRLPLPLTPITEQPKGTDLLRTLGLRRLMRWRYARLIFQLPLLVLALMVIIDGLTGRQLAPRNLATTSVWLHYRGLVVLALAVFGNAFCAACPLMLTRGVSKRLKRLLPKSFHFPKALRSKAIVMGLTFAYFFAYEYFDLWASPWITAWLAIGYFFAATVIDTLFPAGSFCRYVCPLGNFNFVYASAAPTQITAIDHDICRRCAHKPCLHGRYTASTPPRELPLQTNGPNPVALIRPEEITNFNGQGHFPGCETGLFVPAVQSNMDCTLCLNCLRACPYDNVALSLRTPVREWLSAPYRRRGRSLLMLFAVLLSIVGLLNALLMVSPFFDFANWLATLLGTRSEFLILSLVFVGFSALVMGLFVAVASLADAAAGAPFNPVQAFNRWGYVLIALGFGFWLAHNLFHMLTGALSIVPVMVHFFSYRGLPLTPNWRLSQLLPSRFLFPLTAGLSALYGLLAVYLTFHISLRDFGRRGVLALWPMLIFVLLFLSFGMWLLSQPMEMRGSVFGPSF